MSIVGSFWALLLKTVLQKKLRFLLFIQYHKTLLLSYQNQFILFQFLHPLRRRLQNRQRAVLGSKPRLSKQSASFEGSLNRSRMVSGSKKKKRKILQYGPENTLENKYQWNLAQSSQRLLLTFILEYPVKYTCARRRTIFFSLHFIQIHWIQPWKSLFFFRKVFTAWGVWTF